VEGLEHRVPALAARVGDVQAEGAGVEAERPSPGVGQHAPGCTGSHASTLDPGYLVEIDAVAVV
jgi:hypothetical protein